MIVLGLTGSIAMGKSTAAVMFRRLGVPVWDADALVHRLLARGGGAVAAIADAFPGVVANDAVDRERLGAAVFADASALHRLENIVHPRVYADQHQFLAGAARARIPLVVLDVPLLFETGGDRVCDAVAVVSAPAFIQRQRLRLRPGMTEARIDATLARQMPDLKKRRRADFVIPTGLGRACSFRAIAAIVTSLRTAAVEQGAGGRSGRRRAPLGQGGISYARDRA